MDTFNSRVKISPNHSKLKIAQSNQSIQHFQSMHVAAIGSFLTLGNSILSAELSELRSKINIEN